MIRYRTAVSAASGSAAIRAFIVKNDRLGKNPRRL